MPILSIRVQEQVLLAPFTTFRIGGPASYFCEVASEDELVEAVQFARQHGLKIFILGGGSNLLVGDDGFDGLVIRISIDSLVEPVREGRFASYTVAAGTDWNAFVLRVCEQGISGVECLAGIPGSVGGTPVQNVGAYGQEVASTITAVRAFDLEAGDFVTLSHDQCGFAYRHSIFNTSQRGRYVVTAVTFRFDVDARPNLAYADLQRHFADWDAKQPAPTPLDVYHAVRAIRHRKGMLIVEGEADCRSAGSFFKNPVALPATLDQIAANLELPVGEIPHWPVADGKVKVPAAWLLEKAGFTKGFALGQAGISSRHTLALINRGHATAAEIFALRDRICSEVFSRFGIRLEQEPVQPS
ncbi:MAG: UDP-N-acetylmuramate dehydrogenase [Edaphobacter sp.]